MSRLMLGTVCGLIYGALSAASMIPLEFPDKRAALLGAFINRFSIGFVIGAVRLDWPGWLVGLTFGLLLSLADAIITKTYAPIILLGAVGGTAIGFIVGKWGV
jgi:hypothetical protein